MKRRLNKRQNANFQKLRQARAQDAALGRIITRSGKEFVVALSPHPDAPAAKLPQTASAAEISLKNAFQSMTCYPATPNLGTLVTGDWVQVREGKIINSLPRKNFLQRQTPHGEVKGVVANLDQLLIIVAVSPAPQFLLLERYLWAAALLELPAMILLNKSDLLAENNRETADFWRHWDAAFPQRPKLLSCQHPDAAHPEAQAVSAWPSLMAALHGKVSVLVGASGVGKSSIIQKLIPDVAIRIGALSALVAKGQHTTRAATFYALAAAESAVIDLPGVNDFLPWPRSEQGLAVIYPEIFQAAADCRFRDCQHQPSDRDCAVQAAVRSGAILSARLRRYQELHAQAQLPLAGKTTGFSEAAR